MNSGSASCLKGQANKNGSTGMGILVFAYTNILIYHALMCTVISVQKCKPRKNVDFCNNLITGRTASGVSQLTNDVNHGIFDTEAQCNVNECC